MTVERILQDIIDNVRGHTMGEVLSSEIANTDTFDISTGYFDVRGYEELRTVLEKKAANPKFRMRLLMGTEAIVPGENSFEKYAIQHGRDAEDASSLQSSIDGSELTAGPRRSVTGLVSLLNGDNVEVRMGKKRFNHAKCYITKYAAFIGSSNLTGAGMAGNHELNAGLYQRTMIGPTKKWFEHMWETGRDTKQDLIDTLLQSKFGAPATPYETYMKVLFERFKPMLAGDDTDIAGIGGTLTRFQQDAVRTAMSIMSEYGGAIIADATGLGKTNMGLEIMRQKVLKEGKKALLIAPAQVLRSMWGEKLKDVAVNVRERLSMEALGRDDMLDSLKRYRNVDFVLIDESQNFRTKTAKRRNNLMKLMTMGRRKQAVLLTATPINNSIMDLYYQLSIITLERDDYFARTLGIPNLYRHMTGAANKEGGLQQGLEKIQQLLDMVMVRRTRSFIKDVYRDDKINGHDISFPRHEYAPIRYSLSKYYGNIFEEVLDGINSLHMTPYRMEWYNNTLPQEERDEHKIRAHLQVILLLKRFESSAEAVKISIQNKIKLYKHVTRVLKQGRILRPKDFNGIMARWKAQELDDSEDEQEQANFFLREITAMGTEPMGKRYDRELLNEHLSHDLGILESLLRKVKGVKRDKKMDGVIDTIREDGALSATDDVSGKVLVFSEYAATAKYVAETLAEEFDEKEIECITGDTKPDKRMQVIKRFSPRSNLTEDEELDEKEIDILVSTEVLSEGQNLQDCNYVINYDLPWNPMRIVQRTGRIDRLTSKFSAIRARACFPDEELDRILKLVGKVISKIKVANETVGLDAELLGEIPNEKQYNGTIVGRIRALAKVGGNDADGLIADLEREADIMPQTTPMNEISSYIKDKGIESMQGMPMGRRTGKKGEGKVAILAYLQEKPNRRVHFVRYDFEDGKARVPDDEFDVIRDMGCSVDTPLYLPMDSPDHQDSFDLLLDMDGKARAAIRKRNDDITEYTKERQAGRVSNEFARVSDGIRDAVASAENISAEDGEAVFGVLDSGYARPWTDKLRGFLADYEHDNNADSLIFKIKELGRDMGMEGPKEEERSVPPEGEPRLQLVGAMLITGEKTDVKPSHGPRRSPQFMSGPQHLDQKGDHSPDRNSWPFGNDP